MNSRNELPGTKNTSKVCLRAQFPNLEKQRVFTVNLQRYKHRSTNLLPAFRKAKKLTLLLDLRGALRLHEVPGFFLSPRVIALPRRRSSCTSHVVNEGAGVIRVNPRARARRAAGGLISAPVGFATTASIKNSSWKPILKLFAMLKMLRFKAHLARAVLPIISTGNGPYSPEGKMAAYPPVV